MTDPNFGKFAVRAYYDETAWEESYFEDREEAFECAEGSLN